MCSELTWWVLLGVLVTEVTSFLWQWHFLLSGPTLYSWVWREIQWLCCCPLLWCVMVYSVLCWTTMQETPNTYFVNLHKFFAVPCFFFTPLVKYELGHVADIPKIVRLYILYIFFVSKSLDRARGEHFCKVRGRWSWSLFACKFLYSQQFRFWMLLSLNSATLLSCHTNSWRFGLGNKSVLSRLTINTFSGKHQSVTFTETEGDDSCCKRLHRESNMGYWIRVTVLENMCSHMNSKMFPLIHVCVQDSISVEYWRGRVWLSTNTGMLKN